MSPCHQERRKIENNRLDLDDSGKDPQNPITTVAGYIAKDTAWEAFEDEVEHWFTEYDVKTLHAKELRDTDGNFADWPVLKKQAFVSHLPGSVAPLDDGLEHVGAQGHLRATSGRKRQKTNDPPLYLLL